MDVGEKKMNFDNDIAKKKICGNWIAEIGGLKKEKEKKKTELWQE